MANIENEHVVGLIALGPSRHQEDGFRSRKLLVARISSFPAPRVCRNTAIGKTHAQDSKALDYQQILSLEKRVYTRLSAQIEAGKTNLHNLGSRCREELKRRRRRLSRSGSRTHSRRTLCHKMHRCNTQAMPRFDRSTPHRTVSVCSPHVEPRNGMPNV